MTSFKSGTFSASVSDGVASRTGYDATVYGREFKQLARSLFSGPRLAWSPPSGVQRGHGISMPLPVPAPTTAGR
ncbi:DUF4054 domain-containing protein [Novosphingobium sp. B1]|uniref:DUF4054 domain-containing protein n=1 Tax=Novosphingobium sp. B1 TaxID=1938756 RepID=UPI0034CED7C4